MSDDEDWEVIRQHYALTPEEITNLRADAEKYREDLRRQLLYGDSYAPVLADVRGESPIASLLRSLRPNDGGRGS